MAKATSRRDDQAQDGNVLRLRSTGVIFAGTLIGLNGGGLALSIIKDVNTRFIGTALEPAKNNEVLVRTDAHVVELQTVGNAVQNWVGQNMYADDDQTVSTDATGNRRSVGICVKFNSANSVSVLVRPEEGR